MNHVLESTYKILHYWILCVLFSVPYVFFAGWEMDNFLAIFLALPILFFVWHIIAVLCGFVDQDQKTLRIKINWKNLFFAYRQKNVNKKRFRVIKFFWIWTVFCIFPILTNLTGHLLMFFGHNQLGLLVQEKSAKIFLETIILLTASIIVFFALIYLKDLLFRFVFYPCLRFILRQ